MREILFRGKRKDNGEWVEGFYFCMVHDDGRHVHHFIMPLGADLNFGTPIEKIQVEVDANTICQYTGLTDKNGNKIWENDVASFKHEKFDFDDGLEPWQITCLPNKKEYKRNYVVEFCNTPTHYGLRFRNKSIWFMVHRMTVVMHDIEVIGNTFDHPDLLKGE